MGQVYRATDTKLKREVALKILPEAFSADPERLARFQREAEVLASLNHPNIGHIYGLEEAEGIRALVLELVEGPTLADRIKRGPIPLDEALPIAKQIAEALEAAHEAGVIHRDLKPANIKVRDDGTVKVLDFGLAKALDPSPDADPSQSPTLTAAATQMGAIMGTAAYMSPEQAKGKTVDRRSDVWAFGAVLYEMLSGRRAFVGGDVSDTLVAVFRDDPDWSALPTEVPERVRQALKVCLQKDPKQRVRDIAAVRLAMEGAFESAVGISTAPVLQPPPWRRSLIPATSASIIVGVVTAIAVWSLMRVAPPTPHVTRSRIVVPAPVVDAFHYRIALSPGGTHLAYAGNDQLYLRAMDQIEATPVPRTEGAIEPFFSPDGEWIGFWAGGQLKKVSITDGVPVTLCEIAEPYGATWSPDDTILLNTASGVVRIPGAGGTPEVVIPVGANEIGLQRPQLLPGGEWVLFGVFPSGEAVIQSLATGERQVLIENGNGDVRYLSTGHLAYVLDGTLLAVPFDAEQRIITGGPVPLVEGVMQAGNNIAHYAHAEDGTLVYQQDVGELRTLVWVDRQGNDTPLDIPEARKFRSPRLSPDGTRLAVTVEEGNVDVWVSDLAVGTLRRLTTDPASDVDPLLTPDGERVVFGSNREGSFGLFSMAWDGTGDTERLIVIENVSNLRPYAWSPDGALLFETVSATGTSSDIGILPPDGDGTWELLVNTEASERGPAISPDGRWIAYASNQTGTWEIYVERFPELGAKQLLSRGGGDYPVWSQDGRELFYRAPTGLMVMSIEPGPNLRAGVAETLFDPAAYYVPPYARHWEVSPDGQQLLMLKLLNGATTDADGQLEIILVQNWFEELKERVPVP